MLLRKDGHPCVFYGDLYGTLGDKPLKRACKGKLPILTRARKLYAYGEQQDYFDQANCIGEYLHFLLLFFLSFFAVL